MKGYMSNLDFTVRKYSAILDAIISNYDTYTIVDWINSKSEKGFVIRHDVDRRNKNALLIAKLENEKNVRSTYYFRVSTFDAAIVKEISDMGHDIGYHYEDLTSNKGNFEKAIKSFEANLKNMREQSGLDISTIAMHGRWISRYDNRDLWSRYNLDNYGIICEVFLSIDYTDSYYITDTGRNWNSNSVNIRDKVDTGLTVNFSSSNELIRFINSGNADRIFLVTHPERWEENIFKWYMQNIEDKTKNIFKAIKMKADN